MRKLIHADLSRVLRKPTFYILIVLTLLALALPGREGAETASLQIEKMKSYVDAFPILGVGIPVFLAVYTDEMKSGKLIAVLGSGLSRRKILIGKLLDVLILLLLFFTAAYGIMLALNAASGVGVTPKQNLNLLLYCVFAVLKIIGFFALASLVVFAGWNAAGGMIILILAGTMSSLLLKIIQDRLTLPVFDMSYVGLLESSFAGFAAGKFGWQIIPALVIYLGGVIAVSIAIFNRKEIEL